MAAKLAATYTAAKGGEMPRGTRAVLVRLRRDVIIRARLRKGWNKTDLARELGVGSSSVSRMEIEGSVGEHLLHKMGQVLELPIDEMVTVELAS